MSDDRDNKAEGGAPKATPGRYDDKPYDVGKGKPPVRHRFQKGNKASRGRKPGSRNKTDLEKLLDSKVVVGYDTLGRPIRKKLGEAIDRKLVQAALDGDFRSIRLIKDHELRWRELETRHGPPAPTAAELRAKAKQEEEVKRTSARLIAMLEGMAQLKRAGHIEILGDVPDLSPRVRDAMGEYVERRGDVEHGGYWSA